MTPEQIILLMEASAKQYISIDAKINATGYIQEDAALRSGDSLRSTRESSEQVVQGVYEITARWSGDREYWKISRTTYPTAEQPDMHEEIITYSFSPDRTKKLTEVPGKNPRGIIRFGGKREADFSFYTIYMALWENCNFLWKKFHDPRDMTLKYDKISNLYEFKVVPAEPATSLDSYIPAIEARRGWPEESSDNVYTFCVDPTKKFIPVKRDFFANGALVRHFECKDFQKINDIWIPYKYFWTDPLQKRLEDYEVEQISANVPIDDKLLDFDFPTGTIIIDEMAFLKHRFDITQ